MEKVQQRWPWVRPVPRRKDVARGLRLAKGSAALPARHGNGVRPHQSCRPCMCGGLRLLEGHSVNDVCCWCALCRTEPGGPPCQPTKIPSNSYSKAAPVPQQTAGSEYQFLSRPHYTDRPAVAPSLRRVMWVLYMNSCGILVLPTIMLDDIEWVR